MLIAGAAGPNAGDEVGSLRERVRAAESRSKGCDERRVGAGRELHHPLGQLLGWQRREMRRGERSQARELEHDLATRQPRLVEAIDQLAPGHHVPRAGRGDQGQQVDHRLRRIPLGAKRREGRGAGSYAGTASRSFFAFSISFWAMCAGTSSYRRNCMWYSPRPPVSEVSAWL